MCAQQYCIFEREKSRAQEREERNLHKCRLDDVLLGTEEIVRGRSLLRLSFLLLNKVRGFVPLKALGGAGALYTDSFALFYATNVDKL